MNEQTAAAAASAGSAPAAAPGRQRQMEIYLRGLGGARPRIPAAPAELEAEASRRLRPQAAAYILGGAGSEATIAANRAAFARQVIVPRVLRDVSKRDLSVELFGRRHRAPLLLAPIGVLEMAHAEADLAAARAAAAENIAFVFSNQASVAMEACAAAMGEAPRWMQLYWSSDDEVVRSFLKRAEHCGCEAIVLTLDTTLLGWRPRDLDAGSLPFLRGQGLAQYLSDPAFRAKIPAAPPDVALKPRGLDLPGAAFALWRKGRAFGLSFQQMRAAVAHFTATYSRPDLAWDDLSRLRDMTKLPILLKGVMHPEDAATARERGVDGLIVSNHGGRQIDGAIAALDVLPPIVEAARGLPILFDSGIRSGADMVKALALGAKAVLVGRPYLYALAISGEAGVRELIGNMLAEFDITLALSGCAGPHELNGDSLVTL